MIIKDHRRKEEKKEEGSKKEKAELDLSAYYKEKELIKQSTDEMLTRAQTQEQVNNVLDMENISLNSLNEKYAKQIKTLNDINDEITDNDSCQQKLNNSIDEMNKTQPYR